VLVGRVGGAAEVVHQPVGSAQLEFAVASNTSETADDVLDPSLLVAVLLSDEFFAPGGR